MLMEGCRVSVQRNGRFGTGRQHLFASQDRFLSLTSA
jgi:hypothetical protein